MTVAIKVIRLGETNTKPSRLKATCENGRTTTMSVEACTNDLGFVDYEVIVNRLCERFYNQLVAYEYVQFLNVRYYSTMRKLGFRP